MLSKRVYPASFSNVNSQLAAIATNMITNGDFTNGKTGWTASGDNVLSVVDGKLRNTLVESNYMYAYQSINFVSGHKYYVSVKGWIGTALYWRFAGYSSGGVVLFNSIAQGANGRYSAVYTALATDIVTVRLISDTTTNAVYADFDKVIVIDLTEMFGAGYEPVSVTDVEYFLTEYTDYYFNGSVNIQKDDIYMARMRYLYNLIKSYHP